jgi:hypothetical protein
MEVRILRVEVDKVRTHAQEELAQYEKEKAYWAERIEQERLAYELSTKRVTIVEKERDVALEKATFYENAYNVCKSNQKPKGFWCKFKKVLTLGIARCK